MERVITVSVIRVTILEFVNTSEAESVVELFHLICLEEELVAKRWMKTKWQLD